MEMSNFVGPTKISEILLKDTQQIISIDWSGDSLKDLVAICDKGHTLKFYKNKGKGNFVEAKTTNTDVEITEITALENAKGDDLVIIFGDEGKMRIYSNTRDASLDKNVSEFNVFGVSQVVSLDLSENGQMNDIAVTHDYGNAVKFYKNFGNGVFKPVFKDIQPYGNIQQILAIDLDNDGRKNDLAILVAVQKYGKTYKYVKIYRYKKDQEYVLTQTIELEGYDISKVLSIKLLGNQNDGLGLLCEGANRSSVLLYANSGTSKGFVEHGMVHSYEPFTNTIALDLETKGINKDLLVLSNNKLQIYVNNGGVFNVSGNDILIDCPVNILLSYEEQNDIFIVIGTKHCIQNYKISRPTAACKHKMKGSDIGALYLLFLGLIMGALVFAIAWLIARIQCRHHRTDVFPTFPDHVEGNDDDYDFSVIYMEEKKTEEESPYQSQPYNPDYQDSDQKE